MAQLRSVTCHMGSHSVTCYPTQVNTPRLNPSHAGRYSIYLPRRDGRLSWPSWLDSAPAGSRTCDLSITSPTLNQCNHQDKMSLQTTIAAKSGAVLQQVAVLNDGLVSIIYHSHIILSGCRDCGCRQLMRMLNIYIARYCSDTLELCWHF